MISSSDSSLAIDLLTKREAADILRVSTKTVESRIADGKLVATRIGGKVFIDRKDLVAYVESCKAAPSKSD